jgi:hypothetical protein
MHDFLSRRWSRTGLAALIADSASSRLSPAPDRELPIPFIVGCPRSGTTLLRLMLDAHPLIAIPPETHFIIDLLDLDPADPEVRMHFFRATVQGPRWMDFHLDADTFRQHLEAIEPFTIDAGLRVFYRLYADRRGKPRWGDKTPEYGSHMARISDLLPAARFVHVVRDGRDVACSLRTVWWGPGDHFEAHASFWHARVTECRRQGALCPYYYEVQFETLVHEPETTIRKVCQFLELPYSALMLEYHRTAAERMAELSDTLRPDGTVIGRREDRLRIHERTQHPPDRDRVGRWRSELTARQIERVQQVAGPLLSELGYELYERPPELAE